MIRDICSIVVLYFAVI